MTTKYFHFPADPELHQAVKKAADDASMSMSAWLHTTVRRILFDKSADTLMLEDISAKADRILELLEEEYEDD